MDRKKFGELVAALRHDLELTQSQLAKSGRLDIAVLSQIERGVKKTLDANLLVKLAEGLNLTSLERREFYIAADGIDAEQVVRPLRAGFTTDSDSSELALEKMVELIKQLNIPAYLVDVYSDVLAINLIADTLFHVTSELMDKRAEIPGRFNWIRMVFGKDSNIRQYFKGDWETLAYNSMHVFRQQSLRYRTQPYFKYLIKTFRNPVEYPEFNRIWRSLSLPENEFAINSQTYSHRHEIYGDVEYIITPIQSTTRYGELTVFQYLPMNQNTSALIEEFAARYGQGSMRLSPWPEKVMA